MKHWAVGIMGCGTIFPAYMDGLARFDHIEVLRCADIIPERARAGHDVHGIPRFGGPDELLADPEVEVVLNLTPPNTHHEVSAAALAAGKHLYTEKPITTRLEHANELIEMARSAGLVFGSAPDTFLGTWGATSRLAFDSGMLGDVVAATAFMPHNRVETWHPDPRFLFEPGGGPELDRGPYYITALVNLLGPVAEVAGMTRVVRSMREVTAPGRLVDTIEVKVPTHSTAVLRFRSGVLATIFFSSEVAAHNLPNIEIYGTDGVLSLPHPNWFDGDVRFKAPPRDAEWEALAPTVPTGSLRGEGLADMLASIDGAPMKTSPELARHVLEVLLAIHRSDERHGFVEIETTCERPEWPSLKEA